MATASGMDWATHGKTGEVHILIGGIEELPDGSDKGYTLCGELSGAHGWYARFDWNKRCSTCVSRVS